MFESHNQSVSRSTGRYRFFFKKEVILVFILVVAAVLRLWQIGDYLRFSGDEGRDASIVLHFVRDGEIPVVGPPTSIGNVRLGPLYYYLTAVPMALTGNNPVSVAVLVALIGVATVWLVYVVTRELFDTKSGLIAAALYAVAYSPVVMSKSAWNPYPVPFFGLAAVFALVRAIRGRNPIWLILAGVAYSGVIQLHGMGFALLPFIFVYWIVGLRRYRADNQTARYLVTTLFSGLAFLVILFPYVIHEFRHNFEDVHSFVRVFTGNSAIGLSFIDVIKRLAESYVDYIQKILAFGFRSLTVFIGAVLPIAWIIAVSHRSLRHNRFSLILLALWFVSGLSGLALLNVIRREYYFNIIMPVGFILLAGLIRLSLDRKIWRAVGIFVFVMALATSVWINPFNRPSWELGQLSRVKKITQSVLDKVGNDRFVFRFVASDNDDAAYRFFFDQVGRPPIDEGIEPSIESKYIFYVCERQGCENIDLTLREQFPGYAIERISVYPNVQLISVIDRNPK